MSSNYIYNESLPEVGSSWGSLDTIDFKLNFDGMMLPNSIRLLGEFEYYENGVQVVGGDTKVFFDNRVGINSVINSMTTQIQNVGTIEHFSNMARFEKLRTDGTMGRDDLYNARAVAECRVPYPEDTRALMNGEILPHLLNERSGNMPFALMPNFCLNNMTVEPVDPNMGAGLPYSKTNEISIAIRLATDNEVLFGEDKTVNSTYKLVNLKMCYITMPDNGNFANVSMAVRNSLVQTVNTPHSILTLKSPIVADSVIVSFIEKAKENSNEYNALMNEKLPEVEDVEYQFNDAINGLVSYKVDSEAEMRIYTEQAFKSTVNDFSLTKLETGNDGYAIGFLFGLKQLVGSKIAIAIHSAVGTDYSAYIYLQGVINM